MFIGFVTYINVYNNNNRGKYYKTLYANKSGHLYFMDTFLERHKLLKFKKKGKF